MINFDPLPDAPGVYFFLARNQKILYIGKATSIKDRVKSYFVRDILATRSPLIAKMLEEAEKIEFIETDSVLEALLLEANQIKKHQPIYNSREKDDKSYNYVTITKEPARLAYGKAVAGGDFPKVVVTRGSGTYGPFPYGHELKEALKIIRKIFPFRDGKCKITGKPCFNAQIGLCPGPCAGWISKTDYRKQIRNIKLFFEGKKETLAHGLKRHMKQLAREQKFEEAHKIKRQLFALAHIQDIALIKRAVSGGKRGEGFRIEAYDVAHISGKDTVGVMVVVEDGALAKSQYRKFKIRYDKNNDIANLREIITRRFNHPEWRWPNLIVVDGGKGQIDATIAVIKKAGLDIEVVSVVKDDRHKAREVLGLKSQASEESILLANSEAHRFAIAFHRKLRGREFRI